MKAIFFLSLFVSVSAMGTDLVSCDASADELELRYFNDECTDDFDVSVTKGCGIFNTTGKGELELYCAIDSIGVTGETVSCKCD